MSATTPGPMPAPITSEEVAAVVDRQVPLVLRYLEENPLAFQTSVCHLMAPTVLLSQHADRHSQYHGNLELLAVGVAAREEWRRTVNEEGDSRETGC